MNSSKIVYFPGLNGLRAIAAIAVVISHITLALKEFNLNPLIFGALKDGNPLGLSLASYGVSIFFVLSGFLITYLLQVEKEIHTIDIKKFYLRRMLRIWPLYYLYLLVALLTIFAFGLAFKSNSLLLYLFYAANIPFILGNTLPFLSHYWSLGVEEQFYLFWPWVNKKTNSILKIAISYIIVVVVLKLSLHIFYPNTILEQAIQVTRFHCMMLGGAGAILYKEKNYLFMKITDNKLMQTACWIIIFFAAINKFHIATIIDEEIISIVALCLIIGQINIKNRIVNLENRFFDFLGKISYGIYVIHPLVIFLFSKFLNQIPNSNPLKYLAVYTIIILTTVLISFLSYTYFEKHFLKFKKRFEVVKSSATKFSS